jgi:predicted TIM-barrel fold metal-dependent hydrolase
MIKKIDTHLHMAYDGLEREINSHYFADGKTMKEYMDIHNVEHGMVLSGGEFKGDFGSNIDACALAHKYPETFSWMCNVDITNLENLEDRLSHYKTLGAKGVGEFTANYLIDDSRVEAVLAVCEKLEMPFLFHMSPEVNFNYGIVDEPGLSLLDKALAKFPNLIFIGHSQPFWYEISGDMPQDLESRNQYPRGPVKPGGRLLQLFRKYPNLYGDLSANSAGNAIMRDAEFGYGFLEEFQDRLMFGTDMCNAHMYFPLGDFLDKAVTNEKISQTAYEKICRENFIRIMKLDI